MRAIRALECLLRAVALLLFVGGCANGGNAERWVVRHGGEWTGPEADVAHRAARDLLSAFPNVHLVVFAQMRPAAYSWPDGTIALSRGLVNQMPDRELLEGAVAHELGHLIDDGWLQAPAALLGSRGADHDVERRADLIAVKLLESRGLGASTLAETLQRILVADHELTESQRRAIAARIERLKED